MFSTLTLINNTIINNITHKSLRFSQDKLLEVRHINDLETCCQITFQRDTNLGSQQCMRVPLPCILPNIHSLSLCPSFLFTSIMIIVFVFITTTKHYFMLNQLGYFSNREDRSPFALKILSFYGLLFCLFASEE